MFYIDCRISSENGICLKFKKMTGTSILEEARKIYWVLFVY